MVLYSRRKTGVIAFCSGLTYDTDRHGAIRGKAVAFERNRTRWRGGRVRNGFRRIPEAGGGAPAKVDGDLA